MRAVRQYREENGNPPPRHKDTKGGQCVSVRPSRPFFLVALCLRGASSSPRRGERGFVLVAVLWIVAVIGFIAVTFSFQTRTELKAAYYARQRLEAQMLAESAIAQAQALLDEDDPSVDHLGEDWADAAAQFADVPLTGLADGVYSVMGRPDEDHETLYFGLVDECGKVNLNTATREIRAALGDVHLVGVGVDLADVSWAERILERYPNQLKRIFHPAALDYCLGKRRPAQYLAARMAAKEAVVKALSASDSASA